MLEAFSLIGRITIQGVEKVEAALKSIDEKGRKTSASLVEMSKNMQKIGKNMTKYVTLPLSVAGGFIARLGMDFEQAMAQVQAVSSATGEELAKLEEKARELGATTKFSAKEAAQALNYMAMAGWDTQQMLSGIDGVMKLAAASGEDLAIVSDIVTDALTAFGMTADQSTQFADLLANTARNANTNITMLGESFKYVAPVFGSLGYSAEDAALALGLMANAGIKGSQAGTSLRAAITRMVNATGEAAAIIDELGLKLTDAQGNMIPFVQVMDQLRQTFSNLTSEQQAQYASLLFGQEAMSAMLAIINASEEDYRKLTEATREYSGAADEMSNIMSDTLKGRIDEFKSALEELALQYFEVVEPFLKLFIEFLTKLVQILGMLPGPLKLIVVILSTLAALAGPVLIFMGKLIQAWQTVGPVLSKVLPALQGFTGLLAKGTALVAKLIPVLKVVGASIAALALPVLKVVAVVTALAAAVYLVIKNWDKIKDFFSLLWEGIKEGLSSFVSWFTDKWNGIVEFLKKINLFEIGKNIIMSLWNGIKSFLSNIWEGIKGIGKGFVGLFKQIFGIASPSTIFMEIGEDIGEGLELGLLNKVDDVEEAAQMLAKSIEGIEFGSWGNDLLDEMSKELNERELQQKQQLDKIINQKLSRPQGTIDNRDVTSTATATTTSAVQEVIHKHEGVINVEFISEFVEQTVQIVMDRLIKEQRLELRRA